MHVAVVVITCSASYLSAGFDGHRVYALPRFARAIATGLNRANVEWLFVNYPERLAKYTERGFAVSFPEAFAPGGGHPVALKELYERTSQALWKKREMSVDAVGPRLPLSRLAMYEQVFLPFGMGWNARKLMAFLASKGEKMAQNELAKGSISNITEFSVSVPFLIFS